MDQVRHVLFQQHPYVLIGLGVLLAVCWAAFVVLVVRVVQWALWLRAAPDREAAVMVSGLSAVSGQGGGHARQDGETPASHPLDARCVDPPPSSLPSDFAYARDADGYLNPDDLSPCDRDHFYGSMS
jgi:hypothetical protein